MQLSFSQWLTWKAQQCWSLMNAVPEEYEARLEAEGDARQAASEQFAPREPIAIDPRLLAFGRDF